MGREQPRRTRRPAGQLEGEILAVLWAASEPLSAGDVQAALGGSLAYNTVHTILTRLQAKGRVVRVGAIGRSAYQASKGEAEAAADRMRAVLDGGGDRTEILMRFVTTLNKSDEAALRAALDAES
jgi:predicted transcriptional regulator